MSAPLLKVSKCYFAWKRNQVTGFVFSDRLGWFVVEWNLADQGSFRADGPCFSYAAAISYAVIAASGDLLAKSRLLIARVIATSSDPLAESCLLAEFTIVFCT